jgi:cell division protein FtsI (penicillin-binding protein 3)
MRRLRPGCLVPGGTGCRRRRQLESAMLKSIQYRRLLWLSLLVVLAYCGLGWRLVDLQYLSAAAIRQAYTESTVRESIEMPMRGNILDRHGATLTTSIRLYNLGTEPPMISPHQARVAALLAGPLQMSQPELEAKLTPVTNRTAEGRLEVTPRYIMLKREVSLEQLKAAQAIMQTNDFGFDLKAMTKTDRDQLKWLRKYGVQVASVVQTRHYPNGALAGQILGYVGSSNVTYTVGKPVVAAFGLAGIERAFNSKLAGVPGYRRVGRSELAEMNEEYLPAIDGLNVVLTIDRRVQEILDGELAAAHEAMGAKAVFGTVMDVRTGEILGLGSSPGFNPGDRRTFDPASVRLRPILDEFEPGSTFKVIPIAAAIEDGVVNLATPIDCMNGIMHVHKFPPLTDVKPYDVLSVKQVITKSSNIGSAQIVKLHGHEAFYQWMLRFGIGTRTGVGLAEAGGRVEPRDKYVPGDFTRLPIGYATSVTQLQLATIYSAIANGGRLMQPRLIARLEDHDGQVVAELKPEMVRQVISPDTSRKVIEALQTVTEPGGTATEAALEHFHVAGKTGTARKWNDQTKNYDTDRYYASFIGFFPASDPRICIAITVDEPDKQKGYYGGKVAGPIFRKVAALTAHHLNLKPDRDPAAGAPAGTPVNQARAALEPAATLITQTASGIAPARPAAPTGFRFVSPAGLSTP